MSKKPTDSYGISASKSRKNVAGLSNNIDPVYRPADCVNCKSGRCEQYMINKYHLEICPHVLSGRMQMIPMPTYTKYHKNIGKNTEKK